MVAVRSLAALLVSGLVLAMPAPAAAQDAAATSTTWFVHAMTTPEGAGSFLDTVEPTDDDADQTATDTAAIAGDPFTFHSDAKDAAGPFTPGSGDASAKVWVKSWNNGPAPETVVTVTVLAAGAPIATGSLTQDVLAGDIVEYDVPLTMAATELPAGTKVAMEVTLQDATCTCYNPFAYPRGSSPDHPWQFTLPLVAASAAAPGVPASILGNLTGDEAVVLHSFENGTTVSYQYAWPTSLSHAVLNASAVVRQGSANVTVADASNTTLAQRVLAGNGSALADVNGTPGNWSITVAFTNFTGSFELHLGAPKAAAPVNGTVSSSAASASTTAAGKKSPGPAFLPVVGLLAVAVALRRRRR